MAFRKIHGPHSSLTQGTDEQGEFGSINDSASYADLEDPDKDAERWSRLAEELDAMTPETNLDDLL